MQWDVPVTAVAALMLATVRVSAWLAVCPPFNSRLLPFRAKALLSVAIAAPVAPKLRAELTDVTAVGLAVSTVQQVLLGVTLGFITALLFAAVQAAGDLIDMFGGFSMAFAFDPMSATQSSVFGRFYNLLAVTLLFATDGHQMVLRGFLHSFEVLPLGDTLSLATLSRVLTSGLADMFVAALQIAGPLIAVLFCTDVAIGLLNRVAPALNALALSFPIKIFITLAVAGTGLAVLPKAVDGLIDQAVGSVVRLMGG